MLLYIQVIEIVGEIMTTLTIRKTGNANTVSIPKKILNMLNLHVGDKLDIDVNQDQIILQAHNDDLDLISLLNESENGSFKLTTEDSEWLNTSAKGLEI